MKVLTALCLAGMTALAAPRAAFAEPAPLPETLAETGLYLPGTLRVRPEALTYSPQYPLWSDGAHKRRWIYLPEGTTIDASNPDAWEFPPGTRLWKQFGYERPVETRFIERLSDGSWRYAVYAWEADGRTARLAPAEGIPRVAAPGAPGGSYTVPSRDDCLACHEGAAVPVLGFSALQLSPERDPFAAHAEPVARNAVDLATLAERGLLTGLARELLSEPPRIAASTAAARSALGYLHGNCGHCHNDTGPWTDPDLVLAQRASGSASSIDKTLRSLIDRPSEFRTRTIDKRLVPGHPDASMLLARMRSRNPVMQMPPLGTRLADEQGMALIERWIQNELPTGTETRP